MSRQDKEGRRRLPLLATGICLALVLLLSLSAPAFAAEPGSGSGSLPSGIAPVVILRGSDYDMGCQFAEQVIGLYGTWYFQNLSFGMPAGCYEPFSDQQILALKAYQWYLKQYTPEVIPYCEGLAAGATANGFPMTYAEALARQTGTQPFPGTEPAGSENDTLPPAHECSAWAAWGGTTKDGNLICGNSGDCPYTYHLVTVAYPDTGNAYIVRGLGAGYGMNNKGVFFGGTAGEGTRPIDRAGGYDVFGARAQSKLVTLYHAARFANTARQGLDIYSQWKWGGSENRMFADVSGDAYVLEMSAALKAVRQAGDFGEGDFLTVRNNYFTDEGGEANLGSEPGQFYPHGGWAQDPPPGVENPGWDADIQMSSVRTNQTMYNMLSQYQGKVDVEFAKMLWRFAGKMPKDPWDTLEYRATRAAAWETPGNLNNGIVTIAQPADGDTGVMRFCTGPAGRVASPYEAGPDDDFYQIGGTHTFYELTLASDPAEVVDAANWTARHDIALAYQKLMYKNYGDDGFEGLNALYDLANTEYNEGVNWTSRASLAAGNEKVLCQAQALTAFTRAQCHAQQVYEALVAPADDPKDLGLKRYRAISYGF